MSIGSLGTRRAKLAEIVGGQSRLRERRSIILLVAPTVAILCVALVLPMLGLWRASFYPGDRSFEASGWSLVHYLHFLGDSFYLSVLFDTFVVGAVVALVSLVLGFPIGYSLARMPPQKRRWRVVLVIMPLTLSLVVVVFGWLVILGRNGLVNAALVGFGIVESPQRLLFTRVAVILALVNQFLPFMILSIMSAVSQIDSALEQAAACLRANRLRTICRIVIPLAVPGIVSGTTLVFILAVSAFITPRLLGGTRIQMIGSLIYEQVMVTLNWPFGAAMAFILLPLVMGVVLVTSRLAATRFFSERSVNAR